MWAILSGIDGNLAAYEAVIADLQRQRSRVEELYILGDLVGPNPETEKLVQRVRSPRPGELQPQICRGWWEEQCFILHSIGYTTEPIEMMSQYGGGTVKLLWDSVSRQSVEWLRSLDFGFHDLDCLLIHGSTVGVDDKLTPETPPPQMLDRLLRADANNLFCGRSGLAFVYQVQSGSVTVGVTTLDTQQSPATLSLRSRQVIGVGNVGSELGIASYTLYDPNTNLVEFKTVRYGIGKGFSVRNAKRS
ncbi:MAG: hypothetical protein N4J56_004455 [Chroococcidiopsis sp. SAG 2025]|uniref:metallophosphoesterase family protein n=1 Tax=Chroococcidiopsis sp. SAG 2025 TaxID=171389 RepID=UPI0029371825|nr:hypothetical protein [Chroococcidiopsis sp. SAG 2025]MDV2994801.1 hypothetical protein [Chroococcidiopsis sp. SAG 2025]